MGHAGRQGAAPSTRPRCCWRPSSLAVLAYPFLDDSRVGSAVLGVISMVAVGLALWVVRSTPALTVIALALGLPGPGDDVLEAALPGEDWVGARPARCCTRRSTSTSPTA